jgi:hypothetical protein
VRSEVQLFSGPPSPGGADARRPAARGWTVPSLLASRTRRRMLPQLYEMVNRTLERTVPDRAFPRWSRGAPSGRRVRPGGMAPATGGSVQRGLAYKPCADARCIRGACLRTGRGRLRPALVLGVDASGLLASVLVGHLVDALALRGDEGRGTLRKAVGRGEHPLIRGSPNGATRLQASEGRVRHVPDPAV